MAEYNDVIKHFKRMCRYYNSRATQKNCPLYCKGHGCNISHCRLLAFDDKKFQNVVMTWADAHKEPVYPSWGTWLAEKFCYDLREIMYEPIPADLAQKLGVEPKEGT